MGVESQDGEGSQAVQPVMDISLAMALSSHSVPRQAMMV